MKHCPQCRQIYDDDGIFCVADGATLFDGAGGRVIVSLDESPGVEEIPTQYVPVPRPPMAPAADSPNLLYGVIGALIAVILMGGGYLFLFERGENSGEITQTLNIAATPDLAAGNMLNFGANSNSNSRRPVNAPQTAVDAINANTPRPWANAKANNTNRVPSGGTLEWRFNQRFAGTLDNDGIEMQLTRNGSSLSGMVHPHGRYAEIYVDGYIENDGSFAMNEKSDIGVVTGVYRGRLGPDGTINGVWSKPDGDKTRRMFLRRR